MSQTTSQEHLLALVSDATHVPARQVGPANAMSIVAYLEDGRVLAIFGPAGQPLDLPSRRVRDVEGFLVRIYGDEPSYQEGSGLGVISIGPYLSDLESQLRKQVGPKPSEHAGFLALTHAEVEYLRMLVNCDEDENAHGVDTERLIARLIDPLTSEQVSQMPSPGADSASAASLAAQDLNWDGSYR